MCVAAALAGCPPGPRVTGPLEVPEVPPVPQGVQPPMVLCRIEIVPNPPPDAQAVGSLDIAAERGEELVLDDDARQQGCALGATHAVQEQAHFHPDGLYWRVSLYRKLPGPEPFEDPGEVTPRERVEEAQPEPLPGLPEGGWGPTGGRGPF